MRVNALSSVDDIDATCRAVFDGEQFNRLKDRAGIKPSDAHIRKKLEETHPWIGPVYVRTSDFVHLSGKHFEMSIARTDDETRMAYFQISGHDPQRSDETYFEAVDTFFEATKLAGMLLLDGAPSAGNRDGLDDEGRRLEFGNGNVSTFTS